jgi:hypothetical protein
MRIPLGVSSIAIWDDRGSQLNPINDHHGYNRVSAVQPWQATRRAKACLTKAPNLA